MHFTTLNLPLGVYSKAAFRPIKPWLLLTSHQLMCMCIGISLCCAYVFLDHVQGLHNPLNRQQLVPDRKIKTKICTGAIKIMLSRSEACYGAVGNRRHTPNLHAKSKFINEETSTRLKFLLPSM